MNILPNKYPDNIPFVLGSFASAMFLFYFMTGLVLEMKIGHPGSTSAIGFLFIPIYAFLVFWAGYVGGLIVRFIIGKLVNERIVSKATIRIIVFAFLIAIVISSIAGGISFKTHYNAQKPHVIFNSGAVEKIADVNNQKMQIEAKFLLTIFDDEKSKLEGMTWNGKAVHLDLEKSSNTLKLLDDKGDHLITINLGLFEYITRAYTVPIGWTENNLNGLAILVHLRSTSSRSILLIYDSRGNLLYQELLDRIKIDNVLKVIKDSSGKEYLWVDVATPVIYLIDLMKT